MKKKRRTDIPSNVNTKPENIKPVENTIDVPYNPDEKVENFSPLTGPFKGKIAEIPEYDTVISIQGGHSGNPEIEWKQVAGRADRAKGSDFLRRLEILNKCHQHVVKSNGTAPIHTSNFPEAHLKTVLLAMQLYKTDDLPRLRNQLQVQDEYLEQLETRKHTLPEWRYLELKKAAEDIKARIDGDILLLDVIPNS